MFSWLEKKPDAYIDITVDMDELDLTASEAKATYQQIKDYIYEEHNVKVSSLYIAQVKQIYGIIERENYSKPADENAIQSKCSPEKVVLIEEAYMDTYKPVYAIKLSAKNFGYEDNKNLSSLCSILYLNSIL